MRGGSLAQQYLHSIYLNFQAFPLNLQVCYTSCSWSSDKAIVQVVAAPVVGKLAQVGTDRTIGTVLGGVSGFGAFVGYKCAPPI